MLLAYSGLLRASEALQLTWSDLIWSKLGLTLRLGQTKRGQEQRVVLTNPSVLHWMRRFYARCSGLSSDRVVGCGYGTLLRWLRKATAALGWADVPWTTHSLRRGGASELVLGGMPINDLLEFGRWLSLRSAREYIRRGELGLHAARRGVSEPARARVALLASVGPKVWDFV